MANSYFLDLKNKFYSYTQNTRLAGFLEKNTLFSHVDSFIFFSIVLTLFVSLFASSSLIGACAFLTIGLTVLKMLFKKGEKLLLTNLDKIIIVYFLIIVVSVFGSTLFILSVKGFLKTFTYILFYFCAFQFYRNNTSKIIPTIAVLAAFVSFESVVSLFQSFVRVEAISGWQDYSNINPEDAISRVYGTLKPYNPNLLGGYILAGLPSIVAMALLNLYYKNKKRFITWSVFGVLAVCTIFQSGCRGAYLGLFAMIAASFSLILYYVNKKWGLKNIKKRYKTIAASILGVFTLIIVCTPPIFKRILSIFAMREDSSTSFRMNVYQSCFHMFADNPFLGIGAGNQNFRETYGLYMKTGFDALGSYSVPLEIAVESGIFALIAFILIITMIFTSGIKYLKQKHDISTSIVVLCFLFAIGAIMIHGFVDTIYFRPQLQIVFWVTVAMFSSILVKEKVID